MAFDWHGGAAQFANAETHAFATTLLKQIDTSSKLNPFSHEPVIAANRNAAVSAHRLIVLTA